MFAIIWLICVIVLYCTSGYKDGFNNIICKRIESITNALYVPVVGGLYTFTGTVHAQIAVVASLCGDSARKDVIAVPAKFHLHIAGCLWTKWDCECYIRSDEDCRVR